MNTANQEIIPELIIEPGKTEKNYWKDLWHFRELFYILSWRDVKVRYKQTVFGVAWGVIRPLLTMIIFTIIFGKVAGLKKEGDAPYAIMVYAAMLPWQFFSNALSEASNSLLGNTNLITKIYFPRMIIPASSVIVSLVDLAISLGLLLLLMGWYHFVPSPRIFLLPVFILMAFAASFGIGLYITALNVKYRDFRYIIPFIVQFGLYISPVGFSSSVVPEKWKVIYAFNPMVGIIDAFRWSIIGGQKLNMLNFFVSLGVIIIFLIIGIRYFRKTEKSFSDNI